MKNVDDIISMKGNEKVSVLTCYDYSFAKAMDGEVDIILVGDSLGNVVYGYESTKKVTMDDMIRHTDAVKKGAKNTFIVSDLPFGTYDDPNIAIKNAIKLIDSGADAVKPEGKADIVKALVNEGISVMGHLGLLPQTATKMGVVGRDSESKNLIIKEAREIEESGAFSIVVESVPSELGKDITKKLKIPTIGIGAGAHCDGQVLVCYDMLGIYQDFKPKFARRYLDMAKLTKEAVKNYSKDIKKGKFPSKEEEFN